MICKQELFELCRHVADVVRPALGASGIRDLAGVAHSGDATFAVDEAAEDAVVDFLQRRRWPVALYSEDRGLVRFTDAPEYVLVVDPIDGTRPATAGLESTCVCASLATWSEDPRQKDVVASCVLELRGDRAFLAARGDGATILRRATGEEEPVRLSPNTDLERLYWAYEVVGRPQWIIADLLGDLIDGSGVRGGVFVLSSASYALTRLLTGQFDAHIDVSASILRNHPGTREAFLRAGNGRVVNLHAYDISAAILIAREAGCILTDAEGRDHENMRLMDSSESNLQTMVAASNPDLHANLLGALTASLGAFAARDGRGANLED